MQSAKNITLGIKMISEFVKVKIAKTKYGLWNVNVRQKKQL